MFILHWQTGQYFFLKFFRLPFEGSIIGSSLSFIVDLDMKATHPRVFDL